MTLAQLGLVLSAMANTATERAEYYRNRQSNGGKPAPQAEAVAWTLRAILSSGAQRCVELAKEELDDRQT